MKTMIRLLSLAALAGAFALPALAQDPAASPAAAQNPCESQEHTDLYTDYFTSKTKKDAKGQPDTASQKHAFEVGQQFLDKYATACPDKYTESVKKFVDAYKKATRDFELAKAWEAKDYAKVVSLSKEVLTDNPEDLKFAINGAWAAYQQGLAVKNPALNAADVNSFAQRALQLLQAGKTADNYLVGSREEAQGWLEYAIAHSSLKDNPTDAVRRLVALAQGNTPAKREPNTYALLAQAYTDEYLKLKAKYDTFKEETDESRILLANMNQAVDRIIDAYARAVAYSTKPDQQANKAVYMTTLTELYKSGHNNSDAGLNEMIASITTKPLLITTPVTTAPASTPAGTGDGNGGKPPTQPAPTPTPTPAAKKPPVRRG